MLPSKFVAAVETHGGFAWRKEEETHHPGIRLFWDNEMVFYPLENIAQLSEENLENTLQFLKTSSQFMDDWQAVPEASISK